MRILWSLSEACFVLLMVAEGDFHNLTALPCNANVEHGVHYRKVSWYKVEEGVDALTGLVLKNLKTSETHLYASAQHSYEVGEDYSLIFTHSSPQDCGKYHCTLWPPVGHQIRKGDCDFYPAGCLQPTDVQLSQPDSSLCRDSIWRQVMAAGGVLLIVMVAGLSVAYGPKYRWFILCPSSVTSV
ncbi:hypothetical protein GN956_G18313 [Arapaima gigas]